ncbi:MAG: methionine--tRNA ligase [Wolinella sp.]
MGQKSFITTPIYYVNDVPHIGHAYTTMIGDSLARYYRLIGDETFFLTGTDEHGQKIEQSAQKRGRTPQDYADEISGIFRKMWDSFEISYDRFIRTTEPKHKLGVQKAFLKMFEKGDIYKGEYEGHYCVSCETFFTKRQLVDDLYCPECGKETMIVKEESYFFALSKYQGRLLAWYKENPDCILPKPKKNEVIRFVENGLDDLSITRTSFEWGIKLPDSINAQKHVMYVWLDALLNYITALGYGDDEANIRFWPARIHLVGKDILRFHAIYWPAFLMSLELPLPHHVAAHGWWTRNGAKMSKSIGNVINPKEVADSYGVEPFRYFMMREVPFGQDGDFSQKALIDRINSDLSNDLGNLLNRLGGMSGKYFNYRVDSCDVRQFYAREMAEAEAVIDTLHAYIKEVQPHKYLEELWKVFSIANTAIAVHEPWNKIKEGRESEAMALVALIANLLAKASLMLSPVMPNTASKIASALGISISNDSYQSLIIEKNLLGDFTFSPLPPLFPKIEKPLMTSDSIAPQAIEESKQTKKSEPSMPENCISIDEFFKVELKIGTILHAEVVEKSEKLLKLQVDIGEESPRQIVAGIRAYYTPESLISTQVCVVTNLKPAKLMGIASQGMLLAASDEDGLCLLRPETPRKSGSRVK